jgi:hypothetical protein
MPYFHTRSVALSSFFLLAAIGVVRAEPQCDSFETRNAVLHSISDDHSNPLAAFAAKNFNENADGSKKSGADAAKSTNSESEKPSYLLGEKIVTTSTSQDKQTLTCSGAISATVGDTKASKEVNFTVQQTADGKISVSVAPFQF